MSDPSSVGDAAARFLGGGNLALEYVALYEQATKRYAELSAAWRRFQAGESEHGWTGGPEFAADPQVQKVCFWLGLKAFPVDRQRWLVERYKQTGLPDALEERVNTVNREHDLVRARRAEHGGSVAPPPKRYNDD